MNNDKKNKDITILDFKSLKILLAVKKIFLIGLMVRLPSLKRSITEL
jgi:hypothetical protein